MDAPNPYLPPQTNPELENTRLQGNPAGFWARFVAAIIDSIIVGLVGFAFGAVVVGFAFGGDSADVDMTSNILGVILSWLYGAILESSAGQATWGKKMMGLKVTDLEGNRISFARASGRHFGKYISGMILLIGYLMMLWTEKKQTLHDILAGCLVREVK